MLVLHVPTFEGSIPIEWTICPKENRTDDSSGNYIVRCLLDVGAYVRLVRIVRNVVGGIDVILKSDDERSFKLDGVDCIANISFNQYSSLPVASAVQNALLLVDKHEFPLVEIICRTFEEAKS